jgi:hypothetical protein
MKFLRKQFKREFYSFNFVRTGTGFTAYVRD